VAIVTQPCHHCEIGTASLAAGKHVFIEKPLALNIAEADALAEAARAAGRVLMVGHILHYHPGFAALRALASSGALGRILRVQARRLSLGRIRQDEDALWCLAPHDVSMVLALLGARPTSVDAFAEHLLGRPAADAAVVRLGFAAGATALIEVSWLNPIKEQRLTLIGSKGMAVFDDTAPWERKLVHFRHTVRMGADAPAIEASEPIAVVLTPEEPLLAECRHFLDCIETGRAPLTGPDEALAVVQVLDRASRAVAGSHDQAER
jgi:predicted dehydrogenase